MFEKQLLENEAVLTIVEKMNKVQRIIDVISNSPYPVFSEEQVNKMFDDYSKKAEQSAWEQWSIIKIQLVNIYTLQLRHLMFELHRLVSQDIDSPYIKKMS